MILAADDWGISPGVNEGILELADALDTVSIMPLEPWTKFRLNELLEKNVKLSLHLDLTHRAERSVLEVAALSLYSTQFRAKLLHEARSQILTFQHLAGDTQTLESHHNIHLVPWILEALSPVLLDAGISQVRTLTGVENISGVIGTYLSSSAIRSRGLSSLETYSLRPHHSATSQAFSRFIATVGTRRVACHPAKFDDFSEHRVKDPWQNRRREWLLLKSWALTSSS